MPLIEREKIDPQVALRVKVKQSTLKRLEAYVNYVGSSKDYCVEEALLFVLNKDREFAQYEATAPEPIRRVKSSEIVKAS